MSQVTSTFHTHHELIVVRTQRHIDFLDITDEILALVASSGITCGTVNVQSQHTTAAIVLNEHEPLLLEDLRAAFERFSSRELTYCHDDFERRTTNVEPGERRNGHSHCQSILLRTSETLNIVAGKIQLGKWQRIFLVELDGSRERRISVLIMGSETNDGRLFAAMDQ